MKRPLRPSITMAAAALLFIYIVPLAHSQEPAMIEEFLENPDYNNAILAEIKTGDYGFFVHNKGFIFGLHDKNGKLLVDVLGRFVLHDNSSGAPRHVSWSMDASTLAEVEETTRDGSKLVTVKVEHALIQIQTEILCLEDGPRFSFTFTKPEGAGSAYTTAEMKLIPNGTNFPTNEMKPGENPWLLSSPDGDYLSIGHGGDWKPHNPEGRSVAPREGAINFYPFSSNNADGLESDLDLEILVR